MLVSILTLDWLLPCAWPMGAWPAEERAPAAIAVLPLLMPFPALAVWDAYGRWGFMQQPDIKLRAEKWPQVGRGGPCKEEGGLLRGAFSDNTQAAGLMSRAASKAHALCGCLRRWTGGGEEHRLAASTCRRASRTQPACCARPPDPTCPVPLPPRCPCSTMPRWDSPGLASASCCPARC